MKAYDIWVPFGFAAAVGAICLVTHVVALDAWVPTFVTFLPMAFFFSGAAHAQTRKRLAALEARLAERGGSPWERARTGAAALTRRTPAGTPAADRATRGRTGRGTFGPSPSSLGQGDRSRMRSVRGPVTARTPPPTSAPAQRWPPTRGAPFEFPRRHVPPLEPGDQAVELFLRSPEHAGL
jgi:hypothetical protein